MKPRHVLVVVAWWRGYISKADVSTVEGGADTQKNIYRRILVTMVLKQSVKGGGGLRERERE